jgi:hypothetical protein
MEQTPHWMRMPAPRGRAFQVFLRWVGLMVLMLAGTYGWVAHHGLPRAAVQRVEASLLRHGWSAHIGRLQVHRSGVTLVHSDIRPSASTSGALFFAERIECRVDWIAALAGESPLAGVRITGGAWRPSAPAEDRHVIALPAADLQRMPAGWRVREVRVRGRGLEVHLAGLILTPTTDPAAAPPEAPARAWDRFARILPHLPLPEWSGPARVDLDLLWRPGAEAWPHLQVIGGGGAMAWNGLAAETWSLEAELDGRERAGLRFGLSGGDESLALTANLDLRERRATWTAAGALRPERIRALPLPPPWDARFDRLGLHSRAPIAFEMAVEDAPWSDPAERLAGRISGTGVDLMGLHATQASTRLRREGARWIFEDGEALAGRAPRTGPVRGTAFFDPITRDYGFDGEASVWPEEILPVLNPQQSQHAGSLLCRTTPPRFTGSVRGRISEIAALTIDGRIEVEQALFQGAAFDRGEADLHVTNQVLRLSGLEIRRPEGILTGSVTQEFARARVGFDLVSTLSPYAVARWAGPFPHRFAQRLRFEGPVRITTQGVVDYGRRRENHVDATIEGERLGILWLLADRATFDVRLRNRTIELIDVVGRIGGGEASGSAIFHLPDVDRPRTTYQIEVAGRGVRTRALLPALPDRALPEDLGRARGRLTASGRIGIGEGAGVVGEGEVHISRAQLMQIPLLGPVSRLLNALVPGLGMMEQTAFEMTFTLRDGRVHTRDARLLGDTLSMVARGSGGFDGDLDFTVQAQLLRRGLVARVVRTVTLPVTKLLEFDLSGRVDDPKWEPRNLPRELFLKFD